MCHFRRDTPSSKSLNSGSEIMRSVERVRDVWIDDEWKKDGKLADALGFQFPIPAQQ